jgi:fibronectin type 3 domain-containing protein/regulation of enolase protein 1 (concanavalin A-like superfamily)
MNGNHRDCVAVDSIGKNRRAEASAVRVCLALVFALIVIMLSLNVEANGTWTPLVHPTPGGTQYLLLSDGTVISVGQPSYRLTPDIHGGYANSTWTPIASMNFGRLYYSSEVLTNGNVYIAGGEYGSGRNYAELYNTVANTWVPIAQPPNAGYGDADSATLPNGDVLQADTGGNEYIYIARSNIIVRAATSVLNGWQNEEAWGKLADGSILTEDPGTTNSERYIPSLSRWIADAAEPAVWADWPAGEMGGDYLLPNGKMLVTGATSNNIIYTPSPLGGTNAGSWALGPVTKNATNQFNCGDYEGAAMANGNVLLSAGSYQTGNAAFFEYDYLANTLTQVPDPYSAAGYANPMLDLPDGSVLVGNAIYMPTNRPPLASGQPIISNITQNADGSYHLIGSQLNGINQGALGGSDDMQANTDFPLVRMTNNATKNVYYARTYGWNKMGVLVASNEATMTEFSLPGNLPSGTYSLVVVANGNPSAPTNFTYSPPPAPAGLTATAGDAQLGLSWNTVSGATNYVLLRSTTSGAYYLPVTNLTSTTYTDTGLTNGQTYYYVVRAQSSAALSDYSAQAGAAPVGPPPQPGFFSAMGAYQQVILTWNSSFGATNYTVARSMSSAGPFTAIGASYGPGYDDKFVTPGTTYYYEVTANGPNGESTTGPLGATPFTVAGAAVYEIVNPSGGGYALNDPNGGGADQEIYTTVIQQWVFPPGGGAQFETLFLNGLNEQWVVAPVSGGHYEILSALNGLALTATNTRSQLALQSYTGANSQLWTLTANGTNYNIGNVGTGGNIDDWGGGNGTIVGNWDALNGNANQIWTLVVPPTFQGVYEISNPSGGGFALDDPNGGGVGTGVNQVAYSGVNQQWTIQSLGGGYYEILSAVNGLSLTATNIEAQLVLKTFTGVSNQLWTIAGSGDTNNTYNLGNVGTGDNMDDWGGGSGTLVGVWDASSGSVNQEWAFTFISAGSSPSAPTGMAAVPGDSQVALSWNAVSGATGYNVKRATSSGGPYTIVGSPVVSNYTDTGVADGTIYYYVISAVNASGESANSTEVNATPSSGSNGIANGAYEIACPSGGGYALDDPNGGGPGTGADQVSYSSINQQWVVTAIGNNQYEISSAANGLALTASNIESQLSLVPYTGANNQLWIFTANGSDYNINNVGSGENIDDWGGGSGTIVGQWDADTGNENQQWSLTSINGSLPSPWLNTDIGSVGVAGSAGYAGGVFTVNGSGDDIYNTADAFQFVYQPVTGNFTMTAQVTSQSNTDPWAKAGVMARETLNSNSRYFGVYVTPTTSHGVDVQYRSATGGSAVDLIEVNGPAAPYWVRIVRRNNTFTAYRSANGTTWTKTGTSQTITMANTIYIGLPVCAHNNSLLCTATFNNVTLGAISQRNPPITLSSVVANSEFSLQFQGVSDLNYVVEMSTNLVNWTPVYTNALTAGDNGTFSFTNEQSNLPACFYRVAQ